MSVFTKTLALAIGAAVLLAALPAAAQETTPPAEKKGEAELTPEEKARKEAYRRAAAKMLGIDQPEEGGEAEKAAAPAAPAAPGTPGAGDKPAAEGGEGAGEAGEGAAGGEPGAEDEAPAEGIAPEGEEDPDPLWTQVFGELNDNDEAMIAQLVAAEYFADSFEGVEVFLELVNEQISLAAQVLGNYVLENDRLRQLAALARFAHDRVRWLGRMLPEDAKPELRDLVVDTNTRCHELVLATYFDAENTGAGAMRFLANESAGEYAEGNAERFDDAEDQYTRALSLTSPTHSAQRVVRALLHLERGEHRARFKGEGMEKIRWLDRALSDLRTSLGIGLPSVQAMEYTRVLYGDALGTLFDVLEESEDYTALLARAAALEATGFDWEGRAKRYIQVAKAAKALEDDRASMYYERAVHVIANRTGLRFGELMETIAERVAVADVGLVNSRVVLEVLQRKGYGRYWSVEKYGVRYIKDDERCAMLDEAVKALRELGRKVTAGSLERRVIPVLCREPEPPPPPPKKKRKSSSKRRRRRR